MSTGVGVVFPEKSSIFLLSHTPRQWLFVFNYQYKWRGFLLKWQQQCSTQKRGKCSSSKNLQNLWVSSGVKKRGFSVEWIHETNIIIKISSENNDARKKIYLLFHLLQAWAQKLGSNSLHCGSLQASKKKGASVEWIHETNIIVKIGENNGFSLWCLVFVVNSWSGCELGSWQ